MVIRAKESSYTHPWSYSVVNFARLTGTIGVPFRFQRTTGADGIKPKERRITLMRKYELVCIIQPDLDETAFNGVVDRIKGWIGESGGTVDKVDVWGRRKLAYPIRKQRDGQYVLINASLEPSATSGLERNIRFQESVLRHMLSVVG